MSLPQIDDRLCPDPCAGPCGGCEDRVVCRCLKVTEGRIVEAVTTLGLRTVKEVRLATGAGDGCTCCHKQIRALVEAHSPVAAPLAAAG
ncbi:MAG TPA: (2Fe-2S)-binding protein [Urbifossiella sp.]|jgi:NAD(P)H-nitrite reductase large subunit|nr:(2Fe-2S)-binding protein [Urbifossiella sp.]